MQAILQNNPPKQQEVEYYRDFLARLPRASYLRGILADTLGRVEELIANDLAFPTPLYTLWVQKSQADEDLAKTRAAVQEARRELSRLEMRANQYRAELRDLASAADLIAKTTRKHVSPPTP